MTPEFTAELQARLESLVADLRYYHKPTDTRIAPRVYKTMLPDMEVFVVGQKSSQSAAFPAICWGIDSGEVSHVGRHPFDVSLIGVLAVDETDTDSLSQILTGSAEIEELAVALKGLINNCHYAGFRLLKPIEFSFGLPGTDTDRQQPHPVYVLRYKMSFMSA